MAPRKQKREPRNTRVDLSNLGEAIGDQLPPGEDTLSAPPLVYVLDPLRSPLQVLITASFRQDDKGNELADQVLSETAKAEQESCQQLYQQLCDRTELIADEVITVRFPWRLRVGGTRGFRELILPVFHPIYGIPYVPSSSLKGFLRAWACKAKQHQFKRILGFIDGEESSLAAVQILDAFPTKPCLKLDMANPQWTWQGNQVAYGTVPHPLLSMAEVTLKIGLIRTSVGTVEDVEKAKQWLEQAFQAEGLGARVSAGYGQASRVNGKVLSQFSSVTHPYGSEHPNPFEFWSEGIHGAYARNNPEFRPVAVRGVLRYWFRAVALGLYAPDECRTLEQELFGGIEPEPREGSFKLISTLDDEYSGDQTNPHHGTGRLILQTKQDKHFTLLQALLKLAFHIGGIGRGARRPLHCNSGRLRGCFWQSTVADERLPYDAQAWQDYLQELLTAFNQVRTVDVNASVIPQPVTNPNRPRLQGSQPRVAKRTQDILNRNARIYLVPSPKLKHPSQVGNWRDQGNKYNVRGAGLEFFYNSGFKGKNREGQGNPQVGGELEVPSYVWIQANGLDTPADAYQVITVFGVDHLEREKFLQAIQNSSQLKEKIEIILPWL
jgi:CRISPR-associated protein Cmr6